MIIAVDGHSSSGKTTLAGRLAAALPAAAVLHTDDLAWHQGVLAWDVLLLTDVLPMVRSGSPLEYRPPQWVARARPGSITLPGDLDFLLVEGVGASQASLRAAYAMIIWVETDEPTRLARDQLRLDAGEMTRDDYGNWMAEENAYTTHERPWVHADLLISGADSLSPPPESNAAFDSGAVTPVTSGVQREESGVQSEKLSTTCRTGSRLALDNASECSHDIVISGSIPPSTAVSSAAPKPSTSARPTAHSPTPCARVFWFGYVRECTSPPTSSTPLTTQGVICCPPAQPSPRNRVASP